MYALRHFLEDFIIEKVIEYWLHDTLQPHGINYNRIDYFDKVQLNVYDYPHFIAEPLPITRELVAASAPLAKRMVVCIVRCHVR